MKKRIALVGLSIVLVFSLAVGGTLMLFTAKTDIATNVVTTGNITAALQETSTDDAWQTIGKKYPGAHQTNGAYNGNTFTGIKFGNVMPGDKLDKQARVVNTGTNPFYAAIDGVITFTNADGVLTWSEVYPLINKAIANAGYKDADFKDSDGNQLTGAELQAARNYAFLGIVLQNGASLGSNWFGSEVVAHEPETLTAAAKFTGTWYYYDSNGTPTINGDDKLRPVDGYNATEPLFKDTLVVPDFGNEAQDITISIALTGYAVQSDNVTSGSSIAQWEAVFAQARS
jgi:predicted ribosomally synthesized peptide with SipW-like signal peptide